MKKTFQKFQISIPPAKTEQLSEALRDDFSNIDAVFITKVSGNIENLTVGMKVGGVEILPDGVDAALLTFNDQCKARYKELAKQLHPDKPSGDSTAFQEMQKQYEAHLQKLAAQAKRKQNRVEFQKIANAILEIVKATKPEYYELLRAATQSPAVSAITTLLNGYFPKQVTQVNNILRMIQ